MISYSSPTSPATAIWTGDCSIFYLPLQLCYPLNTTFTNVCLKSQTGYPTRTSKLTCPKPIIILTFVTWLYENQFGLIFQFLASKSPGHPRWSLRDALDSSLQPESFCLISKLPDSPHSASGHGSLTFPCYSWWLLPFWSRAHITPSPDYRQQPLNQSPPVLPCPIQSKQQGWVAYSEARV